MAISQNPITGRMRQKMSNVVFSTVFSQNVVRSKPLTVRNPQTTAQVNHRDYFTKVVQLCKILKTDEGVAKRSSRTGRNPKMSGYSYLIKGFMNAEDRTSTPYKPIWQNVDIGPGDIGNVKFTGANSAGEITLTWQADPLPLNADLDDALKVVAIDWETMEYYIETGDFSRMDVTYTLALSGKFKNPTTPKVFIAFFVSPDGSKWSSEPPFLVTT